MHMAGNHLSEVTFRLEELWPLHVRRGKGNYLTIIFIHGLQILNRTDAWRSTWIKRGTDVCWPEAWLPEDLGKEKVRVCSVSYDASQWGKRKPDSSVQDFGSKFVEDIIHRKDILRLGEEDKIVLVGHSFGGIILKSLFVTAFEDARTGEPCHDCKKFFNSTKGLIFYAVPHSARTIARYVQNFNIAFQNRLAGTSGKLSAFKNKMDTLSTDFKAAITDEALHGIKIYSFGEQLEYNKVVVVPWASVVELTGNSMILEANHVDICKPLTKQDKGYQKLLEILEMILEENKIQGKKVSWLERLLIHGASQNLEFVDVNRILGEYLYRHVEGSINYI